MEKKIIRLITQELKRLEKQKDYHRGNFRDTGNQRNYNLMDRYENEIIELQDHLELIRHTASRELRFRQDIAGIAKQVSDLRQDLPDHDGLIELDTHLKAIIQMWRKL